MLIGLEWLSHVSGGYCWLQAKTVGKPGHCVSHPLAGQFGSFTEGHMFKQQQDSKPQMCKNCTNLYVFLSHVTRPIQVQSIEKGATF